MALAILASVVGRGQWWKSRAIKAEGALTAMKVDQQRLKRELKEALVLAMTPKEVEEKFKVVYVKEGEAAKIQGFIYTEEQNAKCIACLDGQESNDQLVDEALIAQQKAERAESIAIRRKKKWKGTALVGIPVAGLAGWAISEWAR